MNEVKERLVQYIDLQGISKREFCKKISVSPPYFSNKAAVGSDVMTKIFINYPLLNFDWVITGRGKMLMANNAKCAECEQWKEKYYKESEEHKEAIKELRALEKKFQSLNLKN